jgi:hypothetical protein
VTLPIFLETGDALVQNAINAFRSSGSPARDQLARRVDQCPKPSRQSADHALKGSPDGSADDGDSGITAAILLRGVLFPRLRGKTASVGDI